MKTNDIKITQRAEYYYTAIDLFQTVHQNRSVLGVLGCKADAHKLLRFGGFFFFKCWLQHFLPAGGGWCHRRTAGAFPEPAHAPATAPCMAATGFIPPFARGLSRDKNILMRFLA